MDRLMKWKRTYVTYMYVYTNNLWKSAAVLYVISPALQRANNIDVTGSIVHLNDAFWVQSLSWNSQSLLKPQMGLKFLPTDLPGWKLWGFRSGIFILSETSYFEAWLPSTLFLLRGEIPPLEPRVCPEVWGSSWSEILFSFQFPGSCVVLAWCGYEVHSSNKLDLLDCTIKCQALSREEPAYYPRT